MKITSVTRNYTALQLQEFILADATDGNIIITLPDLTRVNPASNTGFPYIIKKTSATNFVDVESPLLIDGSTVRLTNENDCVSIIFTANTYKIISKTNSSSGGLTSIGVDTSTSGTDITVSNSPLTSNGTITLNVPTASSISRGLLSPTDWSTFNGKQNALGFTAENVANKQIAASTNADHYYNAPYINTLATTFAGVVYKTGSIVDTVASATERAIVIIPMDADTNNYLYRFFHYAKTSAPTSSVRIRIGTYASPINGAVGADAIGNQTQIALLTLSNNNRNAFIRNLVVNGGVGGSVITFLASNGTTANDETTAATPTTTSINTTTQYYLYISLVTAAGLTYTSDATVVTKTKLS